MIFVCPYCRKEYQHYTDAQKCETACKEKAEAKKNREAEEKKYWETVNKMISDGNKKYNRHYCIASHYLYEELADQLEEFREEFGTDLFESLVKVF